jgi:hypothetical protein
VALNPLNPGIILGAAINGLVKLSVVLGRRRHINIDVDVDVDMAGGIGIRV